MIKQNSLVPLSFLRHLKWGNDISSHDLDGYLQTGKTLTIMYNVI